MRYIARSSKMLLLAIWGPSGVLTRFNAFLINRHNIIRKEFYLNSNYISYTLNDSVCKKTTIKTGVHIFGIYGVEQLWQDFDNF